MCHLLARIGNAPEDLGHLRHKRGGFADALCSESVRAVDLRRRPWASRVSRPFPNSILLGRDSYSGRLRLPCETRAGIRENLFHARNEFRLAWRSGAFARGSCLRHASPTACCVFLMPF